MRPRRLVTLLFSILAVVLAGADSRADISNAAVLFLRIAPGARAAGMGEAYVAIADDATATHWNPAGLGNYPLSGSWADTKVPEAYRPIRAFAALKKGRGSDYMAYEIWALTAQGLARYDSKKWHVDEVFRTRTSENVQKIVSSYFNISDEKRLAEVIGRVADANNRRSREYLTTFRDSVLAAIPATYSRRQEMVGGFDTLTAAYDLCLLNWDRLDEAADLFHKGVKDSSLSEVECDRIGFAVEAGRNRFIPEDLKVPYKAFFTDDPAAIASTGDFYVLATATGLVSYNGKNFRSFTQEDKLPSNNILTVATAGKAVLIGTDSGLAVFSGIDISRPSGWQQLPVAPVAAVGASGPSSIWVVTNGDLYHFDGAKWSNSFAYTVTLDESPESLATKFSIYGTDEEKAKFLARLKDLNPAGKTPADTSAAAAPAAGPLPASGDTLSVSPAQPPATDSASTAAVADSTATGTAPAAAGDPLALAAGKVINLPYLAEVHGRVNAVYVDMNSNVWLGTDSGVAHFDGRSWNVHGQGRKINGISGRGTRVIVAADDGMVEFDGTAWQRLGVKGMDKANAIGVEEIEDELWLASDEKVVSKANGRPELSAMHVKWLPELANDLYYEFVSFVNDFGWGTMGGNVTFISYGKFARTLEGSPEPVSEFDAFDVAVSVAYGTSLTQKLKGGVGAKIIYSHLASAGAGSEVGAGTSTGFALDFGLLYVMSRRLTWGLAVTNIGPKMAYIDAAQADDLPRNLALGFAYKLMQSDYYQFLVTSEVNKILVGLNDGFTKELQQVIINTGGEFLYANVFALRAGYIHDEEGKVKTMTLGVGLALLSKFKFDFAYIPNNSSVPLANTLRVSFSWLM